MLENILCLDLPRDLLHEPRYSSYESFRVFVEIDYVTSPIFREGSALLSGAETASSS